jgi:hypothetical protein
MADGPATLLQAALIAALRADPEVAALATGGVYDEPQEHVAFPYVHLGRLDGAALRIGCHTDDDIAFSVECQSQTAAGREQVVALAHAVRVALDGLEVVLPGVTLVWCDYLTSVVSGSGNGEIYTAVVAFEASLGVAA